jgi:MFS transporter, PPP family, 3-phenylpropionic acid transporter
MARIDAGSSTRAHADAELRRLYGIVGVAGAAFIPFYALLLRDRGLSADQIGLILAATSLAGVVATPFWSHAADTRFGSMHTLQLACGIACVADLALLTTGSSIVAIAACAVVLGAAQGPQTAMTDALTLAQLGPLRLTEYGSFRVWASIGWGIGAVAFGAVFAALGLGAMLPIAAIGIAVVAVFVSRFPSRRPLPTEGRAGRFGSIGDAFGAPRMPMFLLGVLIVATSTHAAWDFVPLRIAAGGGGPFLVGISSGVSAFVEIPFMRSSGSLLRRFGMRTVFVAGASVYVAASLGWAVVSAPVAVTAIRIAIGVGFGLTYVTLVVMTGTLVPERLRNTGQTLMQVCGQGLAPILGSLAGGFVYQHIGPTQLFLGSAVGIVVATGIIWTATRDLSGDARPSMPGEIPPGISLTDG